MEINENGNSPQNRTEEPLEQNSENLISDQSMPNNSQISKFTVQNYKNKKKFPIIPVLVGILLAVVAFFGVWYFVLNKEQPEEPKQEKKVVINTENYDDFVSNPLTGEMYPIEDAVDWIESRPIGVMINNHTDARPPSGLVDADLTYEIVAEGGITRFLAFFLSKMPEKIGPVRSTREYYLVLVKELGDAMIMHEGYSPQAKEAIDTWPVRSLFRGGASGVANWRDNPYGVAFEHTLFTDGTKLREYGEELGWDGKRDFYTWKFKEGPGKYESSPAATELSIDFWYEGDYSAIFKYNPDNNTYLRYMGYDEEGNPVPHKDRETEKQIEVTNVIVQFVAETAIEGDDKSRLEYQLIGSGTGLVFIDGKVVEVTWTKEERDARTIFYDVDGQEFEFNKGKIWISIAPDRNVDQVIYK